jgi:hypothetical protein
MQFRGRLHPVQRLAVLLWVIALAAIGMRVALSVPTSQSVVPVYRAAALRWIGSENLYELYRFTRIDADVFRYPPGFAAGFVPFALLPPRVCGLCWRAVSVLVLLTGLRAWTQRALRMRPAQRGAVFAISLLLLLPNLNNGQANIMLLGLLLHGATAVIRNRRRLGGVCLAVAAGIKVYPVAVALLLAAAFPRQVMLSFCLAIAALAAYPFLAAGTSYSLEQYRSFVEAGRADDRRHSKHQYPPRDLYWVLQRYIAAPSDSGYLLIVVGTAAGMAGLVLYTAHRLGEPGKAAILAFDLGCVWMTVFGPATEAATYSLLAPTTAVCIVCSRCFPARLAFAILAYLLLIAPIVRDFFPNGRSFHDYGTQPIGGLMILSVVLWNLFSARRPLPDGLLPRCSIWSSKLTLIRSRMVDGTCAPVK